jgi:hypothetical protein
MTTSHDAFLASLRAEAEAAPRGTAAYVLAHGRFFEAGPDAFKGRRRRLGWCFINCQRLALADDSLTYCEGFAWRWGFDFALHHAWLLHGDGSLRDPTLREEWLPPLYFGIAFSRQFMAERICALKSLGCLLDDPFSGG